MYFSENIALALSGLKSNKMRSLLTMLGIIIGIAAVIAIVTVGNALTNTVTDSMSSLGVSNVYVMVQEKADSYAGGVTVSAPTIEDSDKITDDMIEAYERIYGDDVVAVSVSNAAGGGKAEDGRLYANVSVQGTNEGYKDANNVKVTSGRYIREADIKSNRNVAVVSDKFVNNMFPNGGDPLGTEVKVSLSGTYQTFTIIGVYEYEDNAMNMGLGATSEKDKTTNMYIPISTANIITSSTAGYDYFIIMLRPDLDSNKIVKNIENFFNKFYENNPKFEIGTVKMDSYIASMTSMLNTVSIAITVIAGISLLVGGIGVMNIMLVSVTERTREIGTRKALGAKNSYILTQFIVEAVIICAIGGIIGVILGVFMGVFASNILGSPAPPSIPAIIIAEIFSMVIGVFFGYYPAKKAAYLDPIEALRYE